MSRWWADADQARGNLKLVDDGDVAQGVGTTALAYHALVREQLAPLAEQTLVDQAQIAKAYDEVDLLPVAVALSKATRPEVGEDVCDSYAVMLVQKWHEDAKLATEAAVRMMSAAGVPMPQVVRRASEVAGIPSGAAATFVSKASSMQMAPDTLADTADRVVMTWASMVGQEEAHGNEDITKAVRRRVRTEDDEFDESEVNRDEEGRFATEAHTNAGLREQRAMRARRAERATAAKQEKRRSLREMAERRAQLEAQTEERKQAAQQGKTQQGKTQRGRLQRTKAQQNQPRQSPAPKETRLEVRHRGWDGPMTDTYYHKQIPLPLAMQARNGVELAMHDLTGDGESWVKASDGKAPKIFGPRRGNVIVDPGVPIYSDLVDSSMGGSGHVVDLHPDLKLEVYAIDLADENGPTIWTRMVMPEFGKAEDWDPEEHPRAAAGQGGGRFVRVRTGGPEAEVDSRAALRAERASRAFRQRRADAMDRAAAAERAERLQTTAPTADQVSRVQAARLQSGRTQAQGKTQSGRIARPIRTHSESEAAAGGFLGGDMEMALLLEDQVYDLFTPQAGKMRHIGSIDGEELFGVPAHDPRTSHQPVGRINTSRASSVMRSMLDQWSPQVVQQYSEREDAEESLESDVKKWATNHQVSGVSPVIVRNRITGTYDTAAAIEQRGYALVGDPATMQAFKAGRYGHLAFIPGPMLDKPEDFLNEDADEADWGDYSDGMPTVEIWQVVDTGQLD